MRYMKDDITFDAQIKLCHRSKSSCDYIIDFGYDKADPTCIYELKTQHRRNEEQIKQSQMSKEAQGFKL